MKKFVSIMLVAAMTIAAVTACSSSSGTTEKEDNTETTDGSAALQARLHRSLQRLLRKNTAVQ